MIFGKSQSNLETYRDSKWIEKMRIVEFSSVDIKLILGQGILEMGAQMSAGRAGEWAAYGIL